MILVTGATGMVGAHLVKDLLKANQSVKALYRNQKSLDRARLIFSFYFKDPARMMDRVQWIQGDLLDEVSLHEAFKNVDEVCHSAAFVSFNPSDKQRIYNTNIAGTQKVVNMALEYKIKNFCFVSSVAAIGNTEGVITEEDKIQDLNGRTAYSISKYHAEMVVWRGITEGLPAVIVNPTIILGPSEWGDGTTGFFTTAKKGMSFYPPGSNGFVDVRDLSEIILKLMNTDIKYERFIINGETVSYKELFHKIASALKVDPPRKELKPFVAAVAWRAEKLRAMISRDEPRITQESIKASFSRQNYSSQKLLGVIDHTFRPIDDTIHHVTSLMENGPGESLYSSKNMEHL